MAGDAARGGPAVRVIARPTALAPTRARPHARTIARRQADAWGVAAVLGLVAVAGVQLLWGGLLAGQDSVTQFYPWYGFLGERLRAGELPVWNPSNLAGAPFAGDPQSGWSYLPAMLLFTALPVPLAAPTFVLLHLGLAALATYALARKLGTGIAGALVAATAFAFTGSLYGRAVCCLATTQVATWVPAIVLGVELAVRSRTWLGRGSAWALAGIALSQTIAGWIGQGAYYALLALGAYAAYRLLFDPPTRSVGGRPPLRARFLLLLLHGGTVCLIAFGLAAAGVLPRLEYNALSNLAGGEYTGQSAYAASVGGIRSSVLDGLMTPSLYYPGAASVALAIIALLLARGRLAVPYAAVLSFGAIILAIRATTPLHALLYALLPRFEALHRHWPERATMVGYLGPALLAGIAVGSLGRWRRRPRRLLAASMAPVAVGLGLRAVGAEIPAPALAAAIAAALLAAAAAFLPPAARRLVPALLVLTVAADMLATARATFADAPYGGFHRIDLGAHAEPTGAAAFLRDRLAAGEPFRHVGYDPTLEVAKGVGDSGQPVRYRDQFADPRAAALLVNNRAALLGLQDVQGYNPVQPARFVAFMTALNNRPQDYHDANVYEAGLDSPLLDLLNVRYLVVPAIAPPDRADVQRLIATLPTVYADDRVRVLENREALPRAWLVHEATETTAAEALRLLATGAVDPRRTALLEDEPPVLASPTDPAADRAAVTSYAPEHIRVATRSDAPGLLMLSEVHYPAWHAYVDGEPVAVRRADHLLRAVPIPAGEHTVELRYESTSLRVGLAISLATATAVIALLATAAWRLRGPGTARSVHRVRRSTDDQRRMARPSPVRTEQSSVDRPKIY